MCDFVFVRDIHSSFFYIINFYILLFKLSYFRDYVVSVDSFLKQ